MLTGELAELNVARFDDCCDLFNGKPQATVFSAIVSQAAVFTSVVVACGLPLNEGARVCVAHLVKVAVVVPAFLSVKSKNLWMSSAVHCRGSLPSARPAFV